MSVDEQIQEIGERLMSEYIDLCRQNGKSTSEMLELLQIKRSYYQRLKSGSKPYTMQIIVKLADLLYYEIKIIIKDIQTISF
ncbi:MAG: hypothetical protein DA328_04425 [Nitrososphaeraceae archaeon]|nr:hypothetical protein [Nitrososphaeraceae archaeon]